MKYSPSDLSFPTRGFKYVMDSFNTCLLPRYGIISCLEIVFSNNKSI